MASRCCGDRNGNWQWVGTADGNSWTVFPLNDAVWAMFYYTQLYICAFSFVRGTPDPSMVPLTNAASARGARSDAR